MRTTLNIDDDVLAAAKVLAHSTSQSIGRVISDLVRNGLTATSRMTRTASGFAVFAVPPGAQVITLEDVKKLEDEE